VGEEGSGEVREWELEGVEGVKECEGEVEGVEVAVEDNTTPTAAHIACSSCSAKVKSAPVQVV